MPKSYPDFPHHTQIAAYFDDYVDHFGFRDKIRFETGVERAERGADGVWSDRARHGRDAPLRRARRRQRPPLGSALARARRIPGTLRRRADRTRTTTSTTSRSRADAWSSSASATARWTSPSSRASSPSATFLSARRGAHVHPEVPVRQAARPDRRQPLHAARCRGRCASAILRDASTASASGRWRTTACRRPTTTSARRTRRSRPTSSTGSRTARSTYKPNDRRAAGRLACASRTARVEQVDAIVWCTGYKVTFPFFDADFIAAPDNDLPLFRRVFHPRHRRRLLRRAAAAARRDHAAGRGAGPVDRRVPARRVRAARSGRARAGHRARAPAKMFKRYVASKRHTMQVDFDNYLHELARERRAGARRMREHGFACRSRRARASHGAPRDARRRAPASASARRRRTAARSSTRPARSSARWATTRPRSATSCAAPSWRPARSTTTSRTRQSVFHAVLEERTTRAAPAAARGAPARDDARRDRARGLPRRTSRSSSRTARCSRCCAATPVRCRRAVRHAGAGSRASSSCSRTSARSPTGCSWRRRSTSTTLAAAMGGVAFELGIRLVEQAEPDVERTARFASELFLGGIARLAGVKGL